MAFLLCFSPPPISDLQKNLTSRPAKDGYFEGLSCCLLGQLAFGIKLFSLPQHLSLGQQSECGLGNTHSSLSGEWYPMPGEPVMVTP